MSEFQRISSVPCKKILVLTNNPKYVRTQLESFDSLSKPNPYLNIKVNDLLDRISTDHIIRIPDLLTEIADSMGDALFCGMPESYGITRGIIKKFHPEIIIAGKSFGMGSSREQAVMALQNSGVKAVIAPSFGPIFERNALYNGLFTTSSMKIIDYLKCHQSIPVRWFLNGKNPTDRAILTSGGLLNYLSKYHRIRNLMHHDSKRMNIFEYRIAKAARKRHVTSGQTILLPISSAYSYVPLSDPARQTLEKHHIRLHTMNPEHIHLFEDHFAYSHNPEMKILTNIQRTYAASLGIPDTNYHKGLKDESGGEGICHRVMLERLNPRKYPVIIATDSHTPTLGALPVLAMPVGSTLFAAAIAYGKIPYTVGSVSRISIKGVLPFGMTIRDAQFEMAYRFKSPNGTSVIEFGGEGFRKLSVDQVAALCNMVPEIFIGDIAVTEWYHDGLTYLSKKFGGSKKYWRRYYYDPHPDASYSAKFDFDLSQTTPWIAQPGNPQNVIPLRAVASESITKAIFASCTNGLNEIAQIAAILKNRKIPPTVHFLVVPGSQTIADLSHRKGYFQILTKAGAIISEESVCSICMGDGPFTLKADETAISATNRNFPGRLGHISSRTYLAGPIITAISAMLGHIPSIREFEQEMEILKMNARSVGIS